MRTVREEKLGLSHARNRAIVEARGDYLMFIDDDETVDRDWLCAYERLIDAHAPDAFGGRQIVMFEDSRPAWLRDDLLGFLGELNALKGATPVRITLFACDSALAEGAPWVFEPWDELRLPRPFAGGGGTSFVPVFEWIERQGGRPDSLVYFTDAVGEFPKKAPDYPVLWLVKGGAPVPFGRRIQLN